MTTSLTTKLNISQVRRLKNRESIFWSNDDITFLCRLSPYEKLRLGLHIHSIARDTQMEQRIPLDFTGTTMVPLNVQNFEDRFGTVSAIDGYRVWKLSISTYTPLKSKKTGRFRPECWYNKDYKIFLVAQEEVSLRYFLCYKQTWGVSYEIPIIHTLLEN